VMGRRGHLWGAICTMVLFLLSVSGHFWRQAGPCLDSVEVCVATHPIHA